jgi:hemerythrin
MRRMADEAPSARRWWREHSELARMVEGLVEAVAEESHAAARAALEELTVALQDHFSVEEEVYFPLVESLSSEHAPAIEAARAEHTNLRECLETLRGLIGDGELAPARDALAGLLDRLSAHELEESKLIADLESRSD